MREHFPPVTINFAHVRIIGIPGLSLVAIAVAIALEFPEGRWLLFSGIAGGLLVAAVLIRLRRPPAKTSTSPPRGNLMACDLPSSGQDTWLSRPPSGNGLGSRPEPSSRSPKTSWVPAGSLLFDVGATAFIGAAIVFCLVGLLACYAPARRAIAIDAMEALRYE